ncbi:MAG TPA: O-antigen ligase family protein [Thermoanaerobaculia bacterium]|nr:O-antigen ligase family protein [Thermoanaerobaculia bacterium]
MNSLHNRVRVTLSEAFRPLSAGTAGFVLLLALVLAAPLPYGGILPGGSFLIEILAFSAAGMAMLSRGEERPLGAALLPFSILAGIAALGVLQLIPLPSRLLSALSPVSNKVYSETAEILGLFGRPARFAPCVSIAPTETASTVLLVLAYLAAFLAAFRLLEGRARRRVFFAAVFLAALAQIALAVATEPAGDRKHGSFVNPDHLAGYLEIALVLAFAVVWLAISYGRDATRHLADRAERVERRLLPVSLAILLWGTVAAGVGLTKSRGGILASLLTALLLLALLARRSRPGRRRRAATLGALALLAGLVFVALAIENVAILRFLESDPRELSADTRVQLWRLSLDAWRQFPVLGSGLGTFREAFRRVQPRDFSGLVEQAHSDPLQLLVTGGAVGAALGAVALAAGVVLLLRAVPAQASREERAFTAAGLCALVSLTLHGLVDFNFSLPAVPVTLAAVLGAAWAASLFGPNEAATTGRGPKSG